jgi:hypothetical protein
MTQPNHHEQEVIARAKRALAALARAVRDAENLDLKLAWGQITPQGYYGFTATKVLDKSSERC